MKEDAKEIMNFMEESEESTQKKFWSTHDFSPDNMKSFCLKF